MKCYVSCIGLQKYIELKDEILDSHTVSNKKQTAVSLLYVRVTEVSYFKGQRSRSPGIKNVNKKAVLSQR